MNESSYLQQQVWRGTSSRKIEEYQMMGLENLYAHPVHAGLSHHE